MRPMLRKPNQLRFSKTGNKLRLRLAINRDTLWLKPSWIGCAQLDERRP